jgi:3-deoxy-manno-octulosonate cytidylyltransferase (CMP-KDO synthetase)
MDDNALIVIPSRYGSTRFPGKPLVKIAGVAMLERVYRIAAAVLPKDKIIVATDDSRIAEFVNCFGGKAVMTSVDCKTGSERVLAAIKQLKLKPEIVVNFQGDAVLTPPWILGDLIAALFKCPSALVATPAVALNFAEYKELAERKQKGASRRLDFSYCKRNPRLSLSFSECLGMAAGFCYRIGKDSAL